MNEVSIGFIGYYESSTSSLCNKVESEVVGSSPTERV